MALTVKSSYKGDERSVSIGSIRIPVKSRSESRTVVIPTSEDLAKATNSSTVLFVISVPVMAEAITLHKRMDDNVI